jgi:K+-transporting ATPase ATPase A chain
VGRAVAIATTYEVKGNPLLDQYGVTQTATSQQAGGNLEGKEVRFVRRLRLFAASTTGTSTGAVNSFHDSYTPGGGAVPLEHDARRGQPGRTGPGCTGCSSSRCCRCSSPA